MRTILSKLLTTTNYSSHSKTFIRLLAVRAPIVDNIVGSPTPDIAYYKGNFIKYLTEDFHKWSNKVAIECSETSRTITFGKFQDHCLRWGGFLNKMGLKLGDTVAIVSPNTPMYPIVFNGTAGAGKVLAPANPGYTSSELYNFFDDCQPKVIVSHLSVLANVREALKSYKTPVKLVTLGVGGADAINIEDILEDKNIPLVDPVDLTGDEVFCLPYSSGTTGKPKGTAVSHNAMSHFLHGFLHPDYYSGRPTTATDGESYMMMLPLFHTAGMMAVLFPSIRTGSKLISVTKFDPNTFIDTITKSNVCILHMVPTLLNFLVNHPSCNNESMGHVHTALCGAAPVPPSAALKFKEKINRPVIFQEMYGMTEVLASHMAPKIGEQIGWTGPPMPNVKAKVINSSGEALPANTNGEICIKTDSRMLYYLNNPKATAETLIDGWIHTGDVGHYDENGYFRIVDRTKELIKVKALQVSPSEIEDILRKHPAILDVGVVGVPDDRLGEAPKAVIVVKEGHNLSQDEISDYLNPKVASHKRLVGGIKFVKELPKTGSGKVMRRSLRDL